MPIQVNSRATGNNGGGATSVSVTPGAISNGDVMLIAVHSRGGTGTTISMASSGWTQLGTQQNSTTVLGAALFWKIASNESGNYTANLSASSKASMVHIAITNADVTQPTSTYFTLQANASSLTITSAALGTWTSTNGLAVWLSGIAQGSNTVGYPASYVNTAVGETTGGNANTRTSSRIATQTLSAVTTVGSKTSTDTGTAAVNIGVSAFITEAPLKPAAASVATSMKTPTLKIAAPPVKPAPSGNVYEQTQAVTANAATSVALNWPEVPVVGRAYFAIAVASAQGLFSGTEMSDNAGNTWTLYTTIGQRSPSVAAMIWEMRAAKTLPVGSTWTLTLTPSAGGSQNLFLQVFDSKSIAGTFSENSTAFSTSASTTQTVTMPDGAAGLQKTARVAAISSALIGTSTTGVFSTVPTGTIQTYDVGATTGFAFSWGIVDQTAIGDLASRTWTFGSSQTPYMYIGLFPFGPTATPKTPTVSNVRLITPAAASVTTSRSTPTITGTTQTITPAGKTGSNGLVASLQTPKTTYKIGVLSGSNAGASYANFASGNSTSLGSSYTLDWTYGIPVVGRTYLVFFTSSGSPGTVSMSDNAGNTWVGTVSDLAMIWRTTVTATLPAGSTWQITVDAGNTQSRINLGIVDFGAGSAFVNTMTQNTAVSASSATYDVSLMAPKYAGRTVLANLYDVNSISASLLTYPSGNVYLNTTGSVPFSAQAWAISDVPPITFNATQSANTFYRFIGSLYRFGVGAVASTPTVKSTLKPAAASLTTTRSTPTITNASSATTIAPAAASLTASPQTPKTTATLRPAAASVNTSLQTPRVVAGVRPAAASLTTTRSTPTITNGGRVTTLAPAKASLTASPQTPTLKTSIKPAAASLTATGQTPVVTVTSGDVTVTPAARSLTATGQTTTLKVSMSPAAGSLATSLKTPTLISTLKPNAGNLTVTGQTPITTLVEKPASGALTLAGQTPTITQTLHPAAGTLSVVGQTPTLALAIKPAAGSLTLTGQTPVVSITTFITPAAGALTTTRFAPTLASVIRPAAGALTLTGQTPVIILSKILQPAASSLTLTGLTPSLATAIRPTKGTLALVGRTPALKSIVRPTAGALVVTGQQVGFAGAIAIAETSTSVRLAYASTNSTLSETSTGVALRNRATRAMITEEVI